MHENKVSPAALIVRRLELHSGQPQMLACAAPLNIPSLVSLIAALIPIVSRDALVMEELCSVRPIPTRPCGLFALR